MNTDREKCVRIREDKKTVKFFVTVTSSQIESFFKMTVSVFSVQFSVSLVEEELKRSRLVRTHCLTGGCVSRPVPDKIDFLLDARSFVAALLRGFVLRQSTFETRESSVAIRRGVRSPPRFCVS